MLPRKTKNCWRLYLEVCELEKEVEFNDFDKRVFSFICVPGVRN